jgi:hypothetical protein
MMRILSVNRAKREYNFIKFSWFKELPSELRTVTSQSREICFISLPWLMAAPTAIAIFALRSSPHN